MSDDVKRTGASASTPNECPECSGFVADNGQECVCEDCGLVLDEERVDHGPDWRAFNSKDRDEKSRVGGPSDETMHDRGLSTQIGWQDKDGYGNKLSSRQRRKMKRLRTWNKRFQTKSSKERNLRQALGEIKRMASALGIPDDIQETASVIYRRALDEDILTGRSIEGMASASLYAGIRIESIPRSLDDISNVSRVEREEISRTYRYLMRELDLEVGPPDAREHLPRIASEVGVDKELEQKARSLLETAIKKKLHSGKNPVAFAGASLYAAGVALGRNTITQQDINEAAGVSEVTVRNRYREILEASGEDY